MELARNIVHSTIFLDSGGKKSTLTDIEEADLRMAELYRISSSPAHRILAVMLEREINKDIIWHMADRNGYARLLHILQNYDPLHCPIASSLTQAQINEFKDVTPDCPHSKEWNKQQAWYFGKQYERISEFMRVAKGQVTLKTGLENVDYSITKYSYAIARFFYTLQVVPQAIPGPIALLIRHAMGVEQIRNSPMYKNIRKTIAEEMESGDLPIQIDLNQCLEVNLKGIMDWMKPRDVLVANAYAFGKRTVEWLETYASAPAVLDRLTQDLEDKQLHHKWAMPFTKIVLDLAEHVKPTDPEQASNAFYSLVAGIATSKILSSATATQIVDTLHAKSADFPSLDKASPLGLLTLMALKHRDGLVTTEVMASYITDNKLEKPVTGVMEGIYPKAIERTRVLHALGLKTNSKALVKEKGKALMDELGL
jgi:hypothetical protein